MDDLDVVDGKTGENYGGGGVRLLTADGMLNANSAQLYSETENLRVLMIYAVPVRCRSIRLHYWGDTFPAKATRIGKGELKYDKSRLLAGIETWNLPGVHYDGNWRHGDWLILGLSRNGAVCVDLGNWPPKMHSWKCNILMAIEPAPNGGWVVISRTGRTREDIRFPVWHHPNEVPGKSPLRDGVSSPGEHLRGLVVLKGTVFAYENQVLYRFANGALTQAKDVPVAIGVEDEFGIDYPHGLINLADDRRLLLWDGDAYDLTAGKLKLASEFEIDESSEFTTIPWGTDGFYS